MCGASTSSLSSLGNFLPSIVESFGYSAAQAQLFSVIPYACAFATLPLTVLASDYTNYKGPFVILALSIAACGYIILLTASPVAAEMTGACLIAAGTYTAVVLKLAWLAINTGGFTKRSTTWALAEIVGQCLAIMGASVHAVSQDFTEGNSVVLAFLLAAILVAAGLMVWMSRENRNRDRTLAELADGEVHPHAHRSLGVEYDCHINFRYTL